MIIYVTKLVQYLFAKLFQQNKIEFNNYNTCYIKISIVVIMPSIKVLVNSIDIQTFQKILDFYNSNKSSDENPLERLNRAEGGFQIKLPEEKWTRDYRGFVDENYKIRQLRWSKGLLDSGW